PFDDDDVSGLFRQILEMKLICRNRLSCSRYGSSRTAPLIEHGLTGRLAPRLSPEVEKLRLTIIEKNRLYFHRWRPQNETYLFGFRKHEQGQNAREIPLFDPLVEAKEKEVARLRHPVPHTYQLERLTDRPEKKR